MDKIKLKATTRIGRNLEYHSVSDQGLFHTHFRVRVMLIYWTETSELLIQ